MKDISKFKCIAFLCEPTVYKYLQGVRKALHRTPSQQINYLLELALELREEDEEVEVFRKWLKKQKERESQQKEEWLKKELAKLEQAFKNKTGPTYTNSVSAACSPKDESFESARGKGPPSSEGLRPHFERD